MAFIESVEKISLNISGTTALQNLGESQTVAKCVPFGSWYRYSCGTSSRGDMPDLNNIELKFVDNAGNDAIRGWKYSSYDDTTFTTYVVEFGTDCHVEQHEIDNWSSGTSTDITLDTELDTDTSKTFAVFYHTCGSVGDDYNDASVGCEVLNTTTIRLHREATGGRIDGVCYIVEDLQSNFDVQHGTIDLTTAHTSRSGSISAVTMADTFIIASNTSDTPNDDADSGAVRVKLASTTTVTAYRGSTGGGVETAYVYYQAISLSSGNVYRGTITWPSTSNQETDSHTSVDSAYSMTLPTSHSNGTSSAPSGTTGSGDVCDTIVRVDLNGTSDGIVADRLSYGDIAAITEWETIEWEAAGGSTETITEGPTTAVTTSIDITKTTAVEEGLTTAVTTSATVSKTTSVEEGPTTSVATDYSISVTRNVDGSATTGVTTSITTSKTTSVEGSATTGATTSIETPKSAVLEESFTTSVTTGETVTKDTSVTGSATTGVTTDEVVQKSTTRDADGESTTAITTDYTFSANVTRTITDSVSSGEATRGGLLVTDSCYAKEIVQADNYAPLIDIKPDNNIGAFTTPRDELSLIPIGQIDGISSSLGWVPSQTVSPLDETSFTRAIDEDVEDTSDDVEYIYTIGHVNNFFEPDWFTIHFSSVSNNYPILTSFKLRVRLDFTPTPPMTLPLQLEFTTSWDNGSFVDLISLDDDDSYSQEILEFEHTGLSLKPTDVNSFALKINIADPASFPPECDLRIYAVDIRLPATRYEKQIDTENFSEKSDAASDFSSAKTIGSESYDPKPVPDSDFSVGKTISGDSWTEKDGGGPVFDPS